MYIVLCFDMLAFNTFANGFMLVNSGWARAIPETIVIDHEQELEDTPFIEVR